MDPCRSLGETVLVRVQARAGIGHFETAGVSIVREDDGFVDVRCRWADTGESRSVSPTAAVLPPSTSAAQPGRKQRTTVAASARDTGASPFPFFFV